MVMGWNPSACFEALASGGHCKTTTRTQCAKLNACVRVSTPNVCYWKEDWSVSMTLDTCWSQLACLWTQTRCGMLGIELCSNSLFLCEVQCAVREIRTAERQFQAPHTASDSRRESSRFAWSQSSLTAVVAEHPTSQQVGISCALRHTRPLHEIDEDNQTRTEKSNSWMCRENLHARRRQWWCTSSRILQQFSAVLFTSVSWIWGGWQWHFRVPTEDEIVKGWMQGHMSCPKAKTSKNIQILSSSPPRLSREALPFHPELLWLARHLQISYSVNPYVEYWPIFHMLSHLD